MKLLKDSDISVLENHKKPYILLFSGYYCPNCKEVEEFLIQILKDKKRPCDFIVYKILYEDSPKLVSLFLTKNGITQIPTTFFIKNKNVSHLVGSKKISKFVFKTKTLCKDEPERLIFKWEALRDKLFGDED